MLFLIIVYHAQQHSTNSSQYFVVLVGQAGFVLLKIQIRALYSKDYFVLLQTHVQMYISDKIGTSL